MSHIFADFTSQPNGDYQDLMISQEMDNLPEVHLTWMMMIVYFGDLQNQPCSKPSDIRKGSAAYSRESFPIDNLVKFVQYRLRLNGTQTDYRRDQLLLQKW